MENKKNVFCETQLFDGIFHFGNDLIIKRGNWIWLYDQNKGTFIEPPKPMSFLTNENTRNHRIMSTLFISSITSYPNNADEKMKKALYVEFQRFLDTDKGKETTIALKYNPGSSGTQVRPEDYPWNLTIEPKVWPQEWNDEPYNVKPSVYWPEQCSAVYITYSGDQRKTRIIHNKVSNTLWYETLIQELLLPYSDVIFVGLFHLNGSAYAFGDRSKSGDKISRLYKIQVLKDFDKYILENMSIDLRHFFGCKPIPTTIITTEGLPTNEITTDSVDQTQEPPQVTQTDGQTETQTPDAVISENDADLQESNEDGPKEELAIIIIAVIVSIIIVLILILIGIIAYLNIKRKNNATVMNTSSGTSRSDKISAVDSIVTINSQTGEKVNKSPKS